MGTISDNPIRFAFDTADIKELAQALTEHIRILQITLYREKCWNVYSSGTRQTIRSIEDRIARSQCLLAQMGGG